MVVTGTNSGIRRACAAFGARGDQLGLIAHGRVVLEGAVREAERAGAGQVISLKLEHSLGQ
ncbi:hypothetical protein DXZ75_19170 [Streptomyces sp. AcE210]|nr:hypothetical protein DXZ75_19170 [Streptomyces sp. AcE210]